MVTEEECVEAQQLLDFDWKLKYAVSSGSMTAVNKPLLRLELCVSKSLIKVKDLGLRKDIAEWKTQVAIAEYNKAELDMLIAEMEAITQALDGLDGTS